MKKQMIILLVFLVAMLSGCALFPLKENAKPLIREEEEPLATTKDDVESSQGEVVKPAAIEEEEEQQNLIYCISPVNVREVGDGTARVLGSLRTGDAVVKLRQDGGWIEIFFEGKVGYVYTDYMSETPPN